MALNSPLVITITVDTANLQTGTAQITTSVGKMAADVQAQFQRMAQQTGQAMGAMTQALTGASSAIRPFEQVVVQQLDHIIQATKATARATTAMVQEMNASMAKMADQTKRHTRETADQFTRLAATLKQAAAAFGFFFGVQGIAQLSRSFLTNAVAMDQLRHSLTAVSGSAQAGAKELKFLEGVAQSSGAAILTLGQQWVGLEAAARAVPGRLEEARKVFVALAETAPRLGKSTDQVGLALYGFQQLVGGATVQLDELQKQLGDQLPGLMPALAKEMDITTQALRENVAAGKVLVEDVLPHMEKAIRSLADGTGPVATAASEFGRMQTAWTKLMDALAQSGALAAVIGVIQRFTATMQVATGAIEAAQRSLGLGAPGALKGFDVLNDQLTKQIQLRDELIEQSKEPGIFDFDPGAAQARLEGINQRIEGLTKEINQWHALREAQKPPPSEPGPTPDEQASLKRIENLKGLKKGTDELHTSMNKLNLELEVLRGKNVGELLLIGLDPLSKDFEKERKGREIAVLKSMKDLQDQLYGIEREGGRSRRTVASENARAEVDILEASLKAQTNLTKQHFDEQRQLLDQELLARLNAGERGADIQRELEERRRAIALEEAQKIEQDAIAGEERLLQVRLKALDAQRVASKPEDRAAAEAQRVQLIADSEAKIVALKTQTADIIQGQSKKTLEEALKDEKARVDAAADFAQQEIDSRLNVIDAQKGLIEAQVRGNVLTEAEGLEQIKALQQEEYDHAVRLLQMEADERKRHILDSIEQGEARNIAIAASDAKRVADEKALNIRQQAEQQQLLNQQKDDYERFVKQISSQVATVFEGLLNRTLNAVQFFKQLFIKTISQLAAEIATRAIIVPIIGQVLGGIGGGLGGASATGGGGMGGIGLGELTTGAGLAKQLYDFFWGGQGGGMFGSLSSGINNLNATMTELLYGMENLTSVELALAEAQGMSTQVAGTVGGASFNTLGVAGGLAAVGGGIYGALTAQNAAAQAAYAVSAAAGAFAAAAASGLLAAAGATAASTGWTGYGLIAAAVLSVIGMVLDSVITPKGPRLAVAVGTGLTIGMEGEKLAVGGDLTSTVVRSERAGGSAATDPLQAGLEEAVSNAVESMVGAINAVAVDAGLLMDSTQQALDDALAGALVLNSSNAEKMEEDIKAQLAFIPLQVSAFFLKPLSEAFAQIKGVDDIDEQIARFGVSVVGMAAVFTAMNQKIEELNQVANTDVLRSFGQIHEQLNAFALQLEQDAAAIAEDITTEVTGMLESTVDTLVQLSADVQAAAIAGAFIKPLQAIGSLQTAAGALESAGLDASGVQTQLTALIETTVGEAFQIVNEAMVSASFDEFLQIVLALPPAVAALDPELQALYQISQAFAQVIGPLQQDIDALINATVPLGSTLATATLHTDELASAIAASGDDLSVLFPLYDQYHQAVIDELALKEAQIQAQADIIASSQALINQINQQLNGEGLTAAATEDLTQQYNDLNAALAQLVAPEVIYQTGAAVIDTLNEMAALMTEVIQRAEQDLAAIEAVQESITGNLKNLAAATTPIDQQIAAQVQHIAELNAEIAAMGDPTTVADPQALIALYDELQQATMDLLALQEQQIQEQLAGTLAQLEAQQALVEAQMDMVEAQMDAVQAQAEVVQLQQEAIHDQQEAIHDQQEAIQDQREAAQVQQRLLEDQASQLEQNLSVQQQLLEQSQALSASLQAQVRGGQPPVQQAEAIRQQIGQLRGQLAGQSGEDALETLRQMQTLFTELQQLGEQTNQLHLIQEALQGLMSLIPLADAQAAIAEQAISIDQAQLDAINAQLEAVDAQLVTLDAQLLTLEAQLVTLDAQLVTLEAQLVTLDAQLVSLDAQLAALQAIHADTAAADAAQAQADEALLAVQQAAMASLQAMQPALSAMEADAQAAIDYAEAQLVAIQDLAELEQALAEQQMLAIAGTTDATLAMLNVQTAALAELQAIELAMQELYKQQEAVKAATEASAAAVEAQTQAEAEQAKEPQPTLVSPLPLPVAVVESSSSGSPFDPPDDSGDQLGGLVSGFRWGGPLRPMHAGDLLPMQHFAMGGMTRIMAEPGEMIFHPQSAREVDALSTVNSMWPRFQVGGSGDGDTVPLKVRTPAFVLNRTATRHSGVSGFQAGGAVTNTSVAPVTFNITVTVHAKVDHRMDIRDLANQLTKHLEQQLSAKLGHGRQLGRNR